VRVGTRVRLRSLQAEGVVTAISENEMEVQIGDCASGRARTISSASVKKNSRRLK